MQSHQMTAASHAPGAMARAARRTAVPSSPSLKGLAHRRPRSLVCKASSKLQVRIREFVYLRWFPRMQCSSRDSERVGGQASIPGFGSIILLGSPPFAVGREHVLCAAHAGRFCEH